MRTIAVVLAGLGVAMSRQTALRALLRLPLPASATPRVLGVDDVALRKRQRYATVINAEPASAPTLAETVSKEVAAHSSCWGKTGPPPRKGIQAQTTREYVRLSHEVDA